MWLASTATPYEPFWPETRVATPVPSRLACWMVPVLGKAPKLAQYRWSSDPPVPVRGSVAVAADLAPTAVSTAVTVPALAGANCTVTAHDLPGPRLIPEHASALIANAGWPDSVSVSARAADPPVFARISVCVAVWPVATTPKLSAEGANASTGPVLANAGPAAATSATAPAASGQRQRGHRCHQHTRHPGSDRTHRWIS